MTSSRDTTPRSPLRAALPAKRTFVVQLRADADLARGVVSGRVENVVSGAAALFDSIEELVARMRDVEANADPERAAGVVPAADERKEPAT